MKRTKYYRISAIANLLEVPTYTVRYWEKQFKIKPFRSLLHRAYTGQDVLQFIEIKRLLKTELYTIKGAKAQLARKKLQSGGK